ncbi:retrovirus-related pol polyprotein from transposon TNT 1-94 [Tanacetum coccineum]|uniref:Retrovirus-related pol polyprotein from transposon TNT 1-94 n=1 Tax=Tanacetum coccineum TaxID=301880 RepID=A0ABQ4XYA8_9ASTR
MENANPPQTNKPHVLSTVLRAKVVQKLNKLQAISVYIDSRLENIDQFLNGFTQPPNEIDMDNLKPNDELVDTPLVSPFLDSNDDSDDKEVLNELEEYGNAGKLCQKRSFTYIMNFVVLEDIGEFIVSDMTDVVMGKPFRAVTQLEYDCVKGLISFTRIFDTYIYRMPHTIPRLKNFNWSKVPPIIVLSQRDSMSGLKHAHEKNKFMYKNCLSLGPEYQVNESMKEWLIHGHIVIIFACLALTACKDYELEQIDVKTSFLHGNLEEVIYMRQPPGYEQDDILIACKSKAEIGSTKTFLKREFDMKELREAKKILGMEIIRDRSRKILRVSQSGYVSKILNNFRIDNRKSVQMPLGGHFKLSLKDFLIRDCDVERMSKVSYENAVGILMHLMVCTRPDIVYAVSIVSCYLANPGKNHWEAVKWILKYLRGTTHVGLVYGTNRSNHVDITGFIDSDYAKDPDKVYSSQALGGCIQTLCQIFDPIFDFGYPSISATYLFSNTATSN